MPVTNPLPTTKGIRTKLYAALLRIGERARPPQVDFTTTALAAKNAITISVTSVTTILAAGQYLQFEDADGKLYPARATANYSSGAALAVEPLAEAIPSGAVARFPAKFGLRSSADLSDSVATETISTFDHVEGADVAPGEKTGDVTLNGYYSHYDAGGRTCAQAIKEAREIWIERHLDVPSSAYAIGDIEGGATLLTGRTSSATESGAVSADFSGSIVQRFDQDPVAI